MALVLADRVQETTTTSGTGTLTLLGAVSGYRTFSSGIGNGNTTYYCIYDQTAQVWEIGLGTIAAGTLARTTVYSNSSGNTSPLTLAGNTASVFAVYTASKTVNLDASGNVSPLGTIASGTWNGSTVGVAYGGTGVTASSGANSVVLRDSNANITINNYIANATNVTAAAGTTVLTVASARTQILTGSTTQTFQLPNATTLTLGQSFLFINLSSGILTVKDNASTTIDTIPSGAIVQLGALSIATSAGTWGAYSFLPATYDFNTSSADFGGATLSNGVWNGTAVAPAYGGTGLTTFTAANNALYSSGSTTLTAGTLPVPAGGTGQTSFTSGYIPYGNTSAALQSSASLQFNGTYLVVGGTTPLGGATNPITAFSASANNYVQTYVYNATNGTSSSADFVAYSNNSTDTHGFADLGYNSSTYADAVYTVTGPNEAYLLGSAPTGAGATGNLVYATDSTGSANAHQWYVGGFTQAKNAWKMQLTSTGLQLANALATTYGGTGLTSFTSGGAVYATSTSALTTGTLPVTAGGTGVTTSTGSGNNVLSTSPTLVTPALGTPSSGTLTSCTGLPLTTGVTGTLPIANGGSGQTTAQAAMNAFAGAVTSGSYLRGNGTNVVMSTIQAADVPTLNQNTTGSAGSVANALTIGTGLSGTSYNGSAAVTIANTGVTSAVAGTGIGVSGATGAVTITNNGVTSIAAGNGMSVSGSTGAVTITATGSTLNSQTAAYVAVAGDAGKMISITTGGVTINNSVFSAGNIVTIYNNSGSSQTITQGTGVTLQWAGQASSTTGNRTLGLYGIATIVFLSASSAVITGAGLT